MSIDMTSQNEVMSFNLNNFADVVGFFFYLGVTIHLMTIDPSNS